MEKETIRQNELESKMKRDNTYGQERYCGHCWACVCGEECHTTEEVRVKQRLCAKAEERMIAEPVGAKDRKKSAKAEERMIAEPVGAKDRKKSAKRILREMIDLIEGSLTELAEVMDEPSKQFAYGEKTAYVECLEMLSKWDGAAACGLDYDIEKRFPLLNTIKKDGV